MKNNFKISTISRITFAVECCYTNVRYSVMSAAKSVLANIDLLKTVCYALCASLFISLLLRQRIAA